MWRYSGCIQQIDYSKVTEASVNWDLFLIQLPPDWGLMSGINLQQRIECVFEAYNRQDAAAVAAEFAPEGKFYEIPRGEEFTKAEFQKFLEDTIFVLYPDYQVEESKTHLSYEWATVVEWTFSGTHEGTVDETNPTGNRISLPIVSIVVGSDDGIISWRDFFEPQALDEQLGRK